MYLSIDFTLNPTQVSPQLYTTIVPVGKEDAINSHYRYFLLFYLIYWNFQFSYSLVNRYNALGFYT